ncbi:MAG: hypothetical protein WBC92_08785 [Terracidiphilus sp.]
MRADRPLICAVASLATGIGLIVAYCHGSTSATAVYPFSGSMLHIDLTTYGPAVLGGLALIAVGLLMTAVAVFAAILSQIRLLVGRTDRMDSILGRERDGAFDDDRYDEPLGMTKRRHEG